MRLSHSENRVTAGPCRGRRAREGVVLLAVLVVVVLLSLSAYHFSDFTLEEYKSNDQGQKLAQARALADSGVHYAAAMLSSPDAMAAMLDGNPYDNPQAFALVPVPGDEATGLTGTFTLLAPPDPDEGGELRAGVSDEAGKINLNALFERDPFGEYALQVLLKLPNISEDIAASIVDWIDADDVPVIDGIGAENAYYTGLNPSYRCKNGPLDSIEELLLVKGVTPALLFGLDRNRNGLIDADEDDGSGSYDLGWSAYLTIFSRHLNADPLGQPLINLNGSDLAVLYEELVALVGEDLAKYIVLYRQRGPASSSGKTQSFAGAIASVLGAGQSKEDESSESIKEGSLAELEIDTSRKGRYKIPALFDLVDSQVGVTNRSKGKPSTTTVYASPLSEVGAQRELLPLLFGMTTLSEEGELPARINVNTAPRAVLLTIPDLAEADVDAIMQHRRSLTAEALATPAWLLTDAGIKLSTLKKLEESITTRTQVYRVQVIGVLDTPGPTARIEAVIDTNAGQPRIVSWRDLTELGK